MNKTGICPKCGSGEILRFDGDIRDYGAGTYILTGKTRLSAVMLNQYVCSTCGYTEQWVDMEDIPKLTASKRARRKTC